MVLGPQDLLKHDIEELVRLSHLLKEDPEKEEIKKQIRHLSKKMEGISKRLEDRIYQLHQELHHTVESFLDSPSSSERYLEIKQISLQLHNNLQEL